MARSTSTSVFDVKEIQSLLPTLHPGCEMSRTVSNGFQFAVDEMVVSQSVRVASHVSSKMVMLTHSESPPFLFVTTITRELTSHNRRWSQWNDTGFLCRNALHHSQYLCVTRLIPTVRKALQRH